MKKCLIQITLMLVACCAYGQGTLVYDQQVSNLNSPEIFYNIQLGPTGQSFIPSLSSIDFIQVYLSNSDLNRADETVTMYMNLWSGSVGDGTFLGQTESMSFLGNFLGTTNFLFLSSVTITPGITYYFQPVVQPGIGEVIGVVPGTSYGNGTAFFNGIAQPVADLWFGEGIIVPEPSSPVLILLVAIVFFSQLKKSKKLSKEL